MFATVRYLGELRTEATHLASAQTITSDAPVDNHGKGAYFSPTDLLCTSLAQCILTTMAIAAEGRGFAFAGATAEVTKTMSPNTPRRIARIDLLLRIEGQYDDAQKAALERIATHCPVGLSLHPDTHVVHQIVWVGE